MATTNETRPAQPIAIDTKTPSHPQSMGTSSTTTTAAETTPERRRRSSSVWSNPGLSTSSSPVSTFSGLQTPVSFSPTFTRPSFLSGSPPNTTNTSTSSSSPMAYFFGSSPVTASKSAPSGAAPPFQWPPSASSAANKNDSAIMEEDESPSALSPTATPNTMNKLPGHFRTSSMSGAAPSGGGGGTAGGTGTLWGGAQDRAAGVMRRLSLSGALGPSRPTRVPSPPSATPAHPPLLHSQTLPAPQPSTTSARGRSTLPVPVVPKRRAVSPMGERMLKGHFDGFGM